MALLLRLHSLRLLSLALASLTAASAQTTVLRAQRTLDVRGGRVVSPAVLVVTGGTIEAVNPAGSPSAAAVIDLGDVTLLPGFIDMHVHILMRDAASYRRRTRTGHATRKSEGRFGVRASGGTHRRAPTEAVTATTCGGQAHGDQGR